MKTRKEIEEFVNDFVGSLCGEDLKNFNIGVDNFGSVYSYFSDPESIAGLQFAADAANAIYDAVRAVEVVDSAPSLSRLGASVLGCVAAFVRESVLDEHARSLVAAHMLSVMVARAMRATIEGSYDPTVPAGEILQ